MLPQRERLDAALNGAAVGPVETRGVLRVTGSKRLNFLHRLSTQHVKALAPGAVVHLLFLEVKGHVVADALLATRDDEAYLVTEQAFAEPLRAHLLRYVMRDDVQLADVSADLRVLPLLGPAAPALLRGRLAAALSWANPRRGAPALDVVVPAGDADALRAEVAAQGAVELAEADLEALRVMAGLPRLGVDFDAKRLPMEAAIVLSAVSFDKGCYLGQEVVVRGTFRGAVQRGLVQLALSPGVKPGDELRSEAGVEGAVTSVAETPDGVLGLGYLKRARWTVGERLATPAGGSAEVRRVLVSAERDPAPRRKLM